jgi:CRP-like cAMP-binding protein
MADNNDNDQEASLSAVRLLGLRRFPGLENVDIDDLAKLLAATTERTVSRGSHLATRGSPLPAAYFVIEGALRTSAGNGWHEVGPNETAGMVAMISEHPDGLEIECTAEALVLELERADFLAFNAENFDMLEELVRAFSARVLSLSPLEGTEDAAEPTWKGNRSGFVERLLFLQGLASVSPFGAEATAELATVLEERRPAAGVLAPAGSAIDALYIVVAGALRFGSAALKPGSLFGLLHAVAHAPLPFDLVASPDTIVLTCRPETLVDLLEDNVPFMLAWLRQLANRLVELSG